MYPRVGSPLVPRLLEPALNDVRIPESFVDEMGVEPGTRLVDLDDSMWRDHDWGVIEALATYAVRALDAARVEELVGDERVFVTRPPAASLGLAPRVENALRRGGLVDGARLIPAAIRDVMRVSRFGARALFDVLTALEAGEYRVDGNAEGGQHLPAATATPSRAVKEAAKRLAQKRWAPRVSLHDPRVSSVLGPIPAQSSTVREAAEWIAAQDYTPSEARSMATRLRRATRELDAFRRMPLQNELAAVVEAVSGKKSDAALFTRFGFSGSEPTTLEQAGDVVGLTRERVRQLEKKFRERVSASDRIWTPVLDRAIDVTLQALPTTDADLQQRLAGLVDAPFSVQSLLSACRVFGKEMPLESTHGLLVDLTFVEIPSAARSAALRLVEHWGASTMPDVESRLADRTPNADPETVRLAVESMDRFSWLDDDGRWFWIAGTRNRVLNQVEKIMSVAGSIELNDLRRGVGRHHRMKGFRPPREVLGQLCVQSGLYTRRDDVIAGGEDLPDWRQLLGENERVLVETLFDYGPIMRRDDLTRAVVDERGLKRNSVMIYLGYSPVIERFAPGVFGLRGANVTAAEVEALIPPRVKHQVLQDHGWTDDGLLWMAFRLSPASVETGVLGTPAAVRSVAEGRYPLVNEDGNSVGTLVVEHSMWGLSPFFGRWGVEAGDFVVLSLDTRERTATISAGTEELLLRFQAGE